MKPQLTPERRAELASCNWLTTQEAAEYAEVSALVIRDWMTLGVTVSTEKGKRRIALAGQKVGGRWRILPKDIDTFLTATTEAAASPNAVKSERTWESDAELRRRAKEGKERLARRLGG